MEKVINILDVNEDITKKQKETLLDYLCKVYIAAFSSKAEIDEYCKQAKAMSDMEFTKQVSKRQRTNASSSIPQIRYGEEKHNSEDEKSKMYNPFSARMVETHTAQLKKSGIPQNRELIKVDIGYHPVLSQAFPDYKGCFEDAWEDFGKKAFIKLRAVSKLMKAQKQASVYSNTVILHDYDPGIGFVNPKPINFMDFAMYPKKEDTKKCIKVYRCFVPEEDLRKRSDISEEDLDKLSISSDIDIETMFNSQEGSEDNSAAVGNIRILTFFVPTYKDYSEDNKGKREKFVLRNALITIGVNDIGAVTPDGINKVLLSVVELPGREYDPFTFATLTVNDIDEPYAKPKLVQYRGHQILLNQLFSAFSYAIPLAVAPIVIALKDGNNKAEDYQIAPNSVWFETIPNSTRFETPNFRMDVFVNAYQFIESDFGKGYGIPENIEGIPRQSGGDKTAREAEIERQSGASKLDYVADWQAEELLQPFSYSFLLQTQLHIEIEVEGAVLKYLASKGNPQLDSEMVMKDPEFWKWVAGDTSIKIKGKDVYNPCPLFRNWIILSSIYDKLNERSKDLAGMNFQLGTHPNPDLALLSDMIFKSPGAGLKTIYDIVTHPFSETDITVENTLGEITRKNQSENFQAFMQFLTNLDVPSGPSGMSRLQQEGLKLDVKEVLRLAHKAFPTASAKLITQATNPAQQMLPQQPVTTGSQMPQMPGQMTGETQNVSEDKSQIEQG